MNDADKMAAMVRRATEGDVTAVFLVVNDDGSVDSLCKGDPRRALHAMRALALQILAHSERSRVFRP